MIELLLQAERAMSVGLVDRADVLYTQIAEADPQNSIAVVGLARVALERGDEPGALELAHRALEIDSENAAASRMVERLEEVLRYREAATPDRDPDPDLDPGADLQADLGATMTPPTPLEAPAQPEPAQPEPARLSPTATDALPGPAPRQTVSPEPVVSKPRWRLLLDRLFRRR